MITPKFWSRTSRGLAARRSSYSARKKYDNMMNATHHHPKHFKGQEIIFSYIVREEIEVPHDDVAIITTDIINSKVRRILVDTGSSYNIIFLDTSKQMGETKRSSTSKLDPLIVFNAIESPTHQLGFSLHSERHRKSHL